MEYYGSEFGLRKRGRKVKKKLIAIASIVISTPIVLAVCISTPIFVNITGGVNWLGFWGSYLGAVLGGIITVIVFWGTLKNSEESKIRDEKRKLFDTLIVESACIHELQSRIYKLEDDELLYQLNTKALEVKLRLELAAEKNIYIDADKPIKMLDDLLCEIQRAEKIKLDFLTPITESKEELERIRLALCKKGFIFEIKNFIAKNDN